MENKLTISNEEKTKRENIRRKVLYIERENYKKKPEGDTDREMISKIKNIIEREIEK